MSWKVVGLISVSLAWLVGCSRGWVPASESAAMEAVCCSVTLDPSSRILADGIDTATVTVIVRGDDWKPVPFKEVQVTVTGSNNTVDQLDLLTDELGIVTARISSTRAETKTVLAVVDPGRTPILLPQAPTIEFLPVISGKNRR